MIGKEGPDSGDRSERLASLAEDAIGVLREENEDIYRELVDAFDGKSANVAVFGVEVQHRRARRRSVDRAGTPPRVRDRPWRHLPRGGHRDHGGPHRAAWMPSSRGDLVADRRPVPAPPCRRVRGQVLRRHPARDRQQEPAGQFRTMARVLTGRPRRGIAPVEPGSRRGAP